MEPVRFAILGTAKIAHTVGPKIQSAPGSHLVGIASRSAQKAADFAAQYGLEKRYGNYQAALDDPDIDAVYLPLPPSMHSEWTIRAAEAGKHVLCEKPLACHVAEVDQMLAACRQHNVVLLDGVMWYHTARAQKLKQLVDDQQPGTVRQITAAFTFHWDTMPMDNLRMHRDTGGGALLDLGWYCVGAALWLFQDRPVEVFAKANWCNDVDIRMNAFLWFADSRVATIECGFDAVRRRWLEVTGTAATLFCDDFTRPWNAEEPSFRTLNNDGHRTDYVCPDKPQEERMITAFCDLIQQTSVHHPWLTLSRETQLVCDALDRSARESRVVKLETEGT
ncbi:MAG: Gfo/Idh/MocA family oxidoreductase [Planctomycetaceae bacterium]